MAAAPVAPVGRTGPAQAIDRLFVPASAALRLQTVLGPPKQALAALCGDGQPAIVARWRRAGAGDGAMRTILWAVAMLACLASCGAGDGLKKLEETFQVASGGIDPTLLGTFRGDRGYEEPRMLRLLVLRKDGTYHGELVRDCSTRPCTVTPIDGSYTQVRAFPDPGRASGVRLGIFVDEGTDAGLTYLRITLKRALIAHSPQVSLFHEGSQEPAVPYFQLEHPYELWCAAESDCEAQALSSQCAQACASGQCACR